MENAEINYIMPTKFWRTAGLAENWAHLGDEIDEFLEVALPSMQKINTGAKLTNNEMNAMAMELADVQVMCNTIILLLDGVPVSEDDLPKDYRKYASFSDNIMRLLEIKAKASTDAKAIIRGITTYSGPLCEALVRVICAAEYVMSWIYENADNRHEIHKMVYLKNERRGYYA